MTDGNGVLCEKKSRKLNEFYSTSISLFQLFVNYLSINVVNLSLMFSKINLNTITICFVCVIIDELKLYSPKALGRSINY